MRRREFTYIIMCVYHKSVIVYLILDDRLAVELKHRSKPHILCYRTYRSESSVHIGRRICLKIRWLQIKFSELDKRELERVRVVAVGRGD